MPKVRLQDTGDDQEDPPFKLTDLDLEAQLAHQEQERTETDEDDLSNVSGSEPAVDHHVGGDHEQKHQPDSLAKAGGDQEQGSSRYLEQGFNLVGDKHHAEPDRNEDSGDENDADLDIAGIDHELGRLAGEGKDFRSRISDMKWKPQCPGSRAVAH